MKTFQYSLFALIILISLGLCFYARVHQYNLLAVFFGLQALFGVILAVLFCFDPTAYEIPLEEHESKFSKAAKVKQRRSSLKLVK